MSVEAWKSLFEIGGVTLLFLTFVFGVGALITTNWINKRQAERLRQFDRSLTESKTALLRQEERAANAERDAADAKKAAAQAGEGTAKALADAAKAEERAADANKRAAELEKEAAAAGLETEKLKQVVTWRSIPPEAVAVLESALSAKPGSVNLRYMDGDPEALFLAIQFSRILDRAKWSVAPGSFKPSNAIVFGIALPDGAGAEAKTLRDAFSAAKISFSTEPLPSAGVGFSTSTIRGAPTLFIGCKAPATIQ
jgi:hypothetical protein